MDGCCEIKSPSTTFELEEKDMFGREGARLFNRVKEEFDHERFLVALTNNYGIVRLKMRRATPNQQVSIWWGYRRPSNLF